MNLEEFDFKEQYQTFHNFGYAKAPDGSDKVVGNKWLHEKFGGRTIFDTRQADYAKEQSRKREHAGKGSLVCTLSLYPQHRMSRIGRVLGQATRAKKKIE